MSSNKNQRWCDIWSVWNGETLSWATATGYSTEAEAAKLAAACRKACPNVSYTAKIREEYSLLAQPLKHTKQKEAA